MTVLESIFDIVVQSNRPSTKRLAKVEETRSVVFNNRGKMCVLIRWKLFSELDDHDRGRRHFITLPH